MSRPVAPKAGGRKHHQLAAALIGTLLCCLPRAALADRAPLTLLPVSTPAEAEAEQQRPLARQAEVLSDVLADAAYDQGFELKAPEGPTEQRPLDDEWLIERARAGWVVSPRIEQSGNKILVRLVAVAPGSNVLLVRSERMEPNLIEVRGVLMLRDLLEASPKPSVPRPAEETPITPTPAAEPPAPHSAGRAVLALNAAVLGGYIGVSLQKASGSDDERLIYPLAALGAGIGLGASLLVADEWDVTVGDAWYVAAGAWWPTAGGLLLAQSYDVAAEDRYVYGIIGASAGIVAATSAIAVGGRMSEGGATIAHSGGAFGMGLGGLTELLVEGNTDATPVRGMGYGAISGVVLGGALATQVHMPTSRVLLIDLGASLGALGGAAAASPLLIVEDEPHPTRTRLWLSSIALGTVAGGTLGWLLTRGSEHHATLPFVPYAGAWPEAGGGAGAKLGVSGSF